MQNNFLDLILRIKEDFSTESFEVKDFCILEKIKQKYSSKNGILFNLTEQFKLLSIIEKKVVGGELVALKKFINDFYLNKEREMFLKTLKFPSIETFDASLTKKISTKGSFHPYTLANFLVIDFFGSIGFEILNSEILTDEYANFTSLNIPEGHSAREEQDTFWIEEKKLLLRTHTSNVQVKEAKKREYPFALVSSGLVYRNEATDASHDFMFAQLEVMYCADDASLSSLLFIIKNFLNFYFDKKNLSIRARPGIFPFVEPGLEIDFQCPFCSNGCSVCKYSKWIEIGGAGMIHTFVKKEMGLKENQKGWALGIGLTRLVMLKYKINDIRKLHQSLLIVR